MSFPAFSCLFASLIAAAAAPGDIIPVGEDNIHYITLKKKPVLRI
jgi:hypothetical protein